MLYTIARLHIYNNMLNENKQYPLFNIDWVVFTLYLTLLVCGWFSICGATHELGDTNFLNGE